MRNYRNGPSDIGPDKTVRSDLPATWSMIRAGDIGCIISTGPLVTAVVLRTEPANA